MQLTPAPSTARRRKGKSTTGHYGDVAATCKQGGRLTKVLTIELKRGYPRGHVANMLDRPNGCAQQEFEKFVQQAWEAHKNAKSTSVDCFGTPHVPSYVAPESRVTWALEPQRQ